MDPKLAEVYGTNNVDEADVEALATAELTSKLAAADEVNLDDLSDEEAETLASEILGSKDPEDPEEPEETPDEPKEEPKAEETEETQEKVAQDKIAEADYLGRVMAHAYVNERREIEKQASKEKQAGKMDAMKGKAKDVGGKVLGHLKSHKKKYMAGGAAAVGGAAAHKMTKKGSADGEQLSAVDQLALARAKEILKENGFEEEQPQEQEKKSSISDEKAALLNQKVQERAVQMLTDAGYSFDEPKEEPKAEE